MPLYKASCSQCSNVVRARTKAKLLSKIRKHIWKKHASWMKTKISKGKKTSSENPTFQDFITALREGTRSAFTVYKEMTEKQYQWQKTVLDAVEPILPPEIQASWRAVEALHDVLTD